MIVNGEQYKVFLSVYDTVLEKEIFEEGYDTFEELNYAMEHDDIPDPIDSLVNIEICHMKKGEPVLLFGKELDMVYPLDYDEIEDLINTLSTFAKPNRVHLTPEIDKEPIDNGHKKELSQFDYVCPYCWKVIEKCSCGSYPYFLIQIDKNILPIIRNLNVKGYRTSASCEGHVENEPAEILILFKNYYEFSIPVPDGSYYSKNGELTYKIQGNSIEEKNQYKKKILSELTKWSEQLPRL